MSEGWLTESALIPQPAVPIAGVRDDTHRKLKFAIGKAEPKQRSTATVIKGSRNLTKRKEREAVIIGIDKQRVKKRKLSDEGLSGTAEAERQRRLALKVQLYDELSGFQTMCVLRL